MGNLFGSSSSSTDRSVNTDNSDNLGNDAQMGSFAEDSYLSNLSGENVISVLDGGVISGAFEFAERSDESANYLTEKITAESFTAFEGVNQGANNLIADSINNLVDGFKSALSFSSDSQREALKAVSETTSQQSSMYGQSLAAVQSGVSSSLTSGNTDIMKIIMLGLVGLGLVFALIGKK